MRQIAILSVLLLGVLWAAAQNSSKPAPKASGAGSQTTVEGCLSSSAGKYTLTDQHGKTFELTGDTSKLADHVGHEIKITGTESSASPSSAGNPGTSSQSLEVSSVKHVSKTCKSGGMAH